MYNPVAANILGTAGAICWSIQVCLCLHAFPLSNGFDLTGSQLIPQIVKNYRLHSTEGLHHTMYLAWAIAGIPLGVYSLSQDFNIALQIQPHILILLSLITWAQCQYYGARWKRVRILTTSTLVALCIGGVESGLYFALREAQRHDLEWPLILMAVVAAILLSLGVARYYWEIYKSASVQGISFLFVLIDASGDLVSILSLLFEARIDVVGVVIYSVELGLWVGIAFLVGYFRLWPWLMLKTAKEPEMV